MNDISNMENLCSVSKHLYLSRFVSSLVVVCALYIPGNPVSAASSDYLEVYVKLHLSLDLTDDGVQQSTSLSNNSSRFGLQGKHFTSSATALIWRVEQKTYIDESGGRFANPAYAGFDGPYGRVFVGFIDTPYKSFVSKFNVMDDTVADVRSILSYSPLGAYESGTTAADHVNVRARNAIYYDKEWSNYRLALLYSMDRTGDGIASGADDNDNAGISCSFEYKADKIILGIAAENWDGGQELQGIRIGGRYSWHDYDFGMVWEQIDSASNTAYNRDAYAIDVGYKLNDKNRLVLQYIAADSSEGLPNSSANMISLGTYHNYDNKLTFYLIASALDNGMNAEYRLGTSGHGDIIAPLAGDDVWALSFGFTYKFSKKFRLL